MKVKMMMEVEWESGVEFDGQRMRPVIKYKVPGGHFIVYKSGPTMGFLSKPAHAVADEVLKKIIEQENNKQHER